MAKKKKFRMKNILATLLDQSKNPGEYISVHATEMVIKDLDKKKKYLEELKKVEKEAGVVEIDFRKGEVK